MRTVPEIVRYGPYYLPLNDFIASKGSNFNVSFAITSSGVVPFGGPKSLPYIIHNADYVISFDPLRSVRIFRVSKLYV